jgi:hypothetical protein
MMEEMSKHGKVGLAALRAGMDRKTARRYVKLGKLPSETKEPRTWRTRDNPFEQDWGWVEGLLSTTPELEAKTLFEALQERRPGSYQDGQLRTLQRHIRQWKAQQGPEQELHFAQEHRPGEAAQTDFMCAKLQVTICGAAFVHMLCHFVLPYSNWEWVTVCFSESFLALKQGVQSALFRLGRRPQWHQTDNSTAATHRPSKGNRKFNDDYAALMNHLGMKPRTIAIGKKEQNGDVEAANGALRRRLEQALLLRGSRDFPSVDEYEGWVGAQVDKANRNREAKLAEELATMVPLNVARLAEYQELDVAVSGGGTIRIMRNAYSVPSRLKRHQVKVRVFERQIEVWYGGVRQLTTERLRGRAGHSINYRHVIWSLVNKPGAFARYRYREDMFPSPVFRRAYDAIVGQEPNVRGDLEYLRILHLAAATMQCEVEAALECLLEANETPSAEAAKALVKPEDTELPELDEYTVDLNSYDELLGHKEEAS